MVQKGHTKKDPLNIGGVKNNFQVEKFIQDIVKKPFWLLSAEIAIEEFAIWTQRKSI
jgi:hypothetical protein